MFPRMRQRLGSALRDNLDLMVEFSTLGEYRLMDPGAQAPRMLAGQATAEPAARLPLPTGPATAAARRMRGSHAPASQPRAATRRQRAGATAPPEQVCLTADAA